MPSTGIRQPKFITIQPAGRVATSLAPSSMDWRNMALDTNEMIGRGTQLIPNVLLSQPESYIPGGYARGFEIAIFPQNQTTERYWQISAQTLSGTNEPLTVEIGDWFRKDIQIDGSRQVYSFVETVPSGQLGQAVFYLPVTFSIQGNQTFEAYFKSTASVQTLSCYGLPRPFLDYTDGRDNPTINEDSFLSNSPIYHQASENPDNSVTALGYAVSSALNIVRRSAGWYWLSPSYWGYWHAPVVTTGGIGYHYGGPGPQPGPYLTSSLTSSVTTSINIFHPTPYSSSIQMRRIFSNEESAQMMVYVLAATDTSGANVTGSIRFTTTTGSLTISMPLTTTPTWFSGALTMRVDGTSSLGFPSGRTDMERFSVVTWVSGVV